VILGVLIALLGGWQLLGTPGGAAQDETPDGQDAEGRRATIVAGGCDEGDFGEAVASLTDLTAAAGDAVGQENAAGLAETSLTNVPLSLDDLLADDHAVVAQLSADEDAGAIACGEVGGVLDENGDLVVALRQQNGSGFTGIAYLSDAGDGTTNVSLFVAQTDGVAAPETAAGVAATPGATPEIGVGATPVVLAAPEEVEPQIVDVSLTEFAIDLETTLEAGPVVFDVANDGTIRHNFAIEGEGVDVSLAENLQPGESDALEVDLEPGTYTVYCPVGRHREQGMEVELTVE
jgi:uncharacterized cupredoxin-like copper-binding protein